MATMVMLFITSVLHPAIRKIIYVVQVVTMETMKDTEGQEFQTQQFLLAREVKKT